jgi:Undecaprenyl-phosphate glucose phosphotransferase
VTSQYIFTAFFIAALILVVSVAFHQFDALHIRPRHVFLWSSLGSTLLAFALFLSTMYLLKLAEDYSRGALIFQIICVCLALLSVRAIAYTRLRSAVASGSIESRRVIIIGDVTQRAKVADRLCNDGIRIVGSLAFPTDAGSQHLIKSNHADVSNISNECRLARPDDIIILADQRQFSLAKSLAYQLSDLPFGVHVVLTDAADLMASLQIAEVGSLTTMEVSRPPLSSADLAVKRAVDVVGSLSGLLLLSPLLLFVSIAIKLDSRGPIFFRQLRHGFNNEPIQVIKFRSMHVVEDGRMFTQATRNDSRVTRVGRLIRRTSIDEIPQLINVLHGDMSIVGPRPHATAHNELFKKRILRLVRRHNVKPGITGWAQINGCRGETDTLEKMQRRVEYDLYYIDNWSVLLDMKIIMMTLFAVLSKTNYTNSY